MRKSDATEKIDRIDRRVIEALAIAPVIREVSQKLGEKEARAILRDINEREAFQRGRCAFKPDRGNGIDELVEDVETWGAGTDWEMEILERTATTYFFNVKRCPYFEKYRELGLDDLGVELSCCRDEPFARGLNPRLKLVRTKTIMEGADVCDFRYYLQAE